MECREYECERYRGVQGAEVEDDGCVLPARSEVERTKNMLYGYEGYKIYVVVLWE